MIIIPEWHMHWYLVKSPVYDYCDGYEYGYVDRGTAIDLAVVKAPSRKKAIGKAGARWKKIRGTYSNDSNNPFVGLQAKKMSEEELKDWFGEGEPEEDYCP